MQVDHDLASFDNKKVLFCRSFMERTGIEPVTSGLQSHPIARLHLTPTNRIGMAESKSPFSSNLARHRSTPVRSHRARTAAA
jgi:hypothetical protein